MKLYNTIKHNIDKKLYPYHCMRPSLKQLKNKQNIIGCEIGVLEGDNANTICRVLDIKKLYLIDPYYDENNFKIAKNKLKKFNDKIVFIKKKSGNAVSFIPDDLDFVYIDGNHEYDFVKKDIELYYPKLKNHGVLAGHNFESKFIGVIEAVMEFVKQNNLNKNFTTYEEDWWIIN